MEHYYTARPGSKPDPHQFTVKLRGIELNLATDAGVFAKERLDRGTELLIKALPLDEKLESILDLGCGYGPIGLTIAKLLPRVTVCMSDINERAVALAAENATRNGIANLEIKAGAGLTPFAGRQFDLIVSNPPIRAGKAVLYDLMDQAYQALRPGGWLATVILTRQGAKSLEKKLAASFGNVVEWDKGSGYRVVASQRTGAV